MGCYDDLALGLQTVVTTCSPRKPKDAASKRALKAFLTVVWNLIGLEEWSWGWEPSTGIRRDWEQCVIRVGGKT